MTDTNNERTLGNHEARLDSLEDTLKEVKDDVKEILAQMAENKGSWKALTALGSASAVVGGIVAELISRTLRG